MIEEIKFRYGSSFKALGGGVVYWTDGYGQRVMLSGFFEGKTTTTTTN